MLIKANEARRGTPSLEASLMTSELFVEQIGNFRKVEIGNKAIFTDNEKIEFRTSIQPLFHKNFDLVSQSFMQSIREGYHIYILSDSKKQTDRIAGIFNDRGDEINFTSVLKTLHEGFVDHDLKLCCYTDHQIFDRYHKYSLRSDSARAGKVVMTLKELNQLNQGDYVVHGTDLYEERKAGYIPFRSVLFPTIDHFVFISEDGKKYLTRKYLQWVHNQHLFRLGVPDQGINPQGKPGVLHLVSCSYMVPVKRIPLLIEALMLIDMPVKWTHIGSGSQWEEVDRLVKKLPQNVEAELMGALKNSEVIEYYRQTPIDIFMNVSESEGVPVSIMEALSFGIPVIATNAGGTGEIVDEAVGTLLPVAITADELAPAIIQLQQRLQESHLRQNARNRWKERCNAEQQYTSFAAFLRSL